METDMAFQEFSQTFAVREETLRCLDQWHNAAASSKNQSGRTTTSIELDTDRILRRLVPSEVNALESTQCSCTDDDWSQIWLLLSSRATRFESQERTNTVVSAALKRLASNTTFDGVVILDLRMIETSTASVASISSPPRQWQKLRPGLHSNLMISNCIVELPVCRVYRNSLIGNTFIGSGTTILNCGEIVTTSSKRSQYGALRISVGPESGGGRHLMVKAEHTMIDVCRQLQKGERISKKSSQFVTTNDKWNVFLSGCLVRDTATIQNVFLHENASIQNATSVRKATLLPRAVVANGCTARNVLMQWDSVIQGHSTVSDSLLMEQVRCGPSSIVADTVLGPDVQTSAGEVHASVLGPNTNAHHQSLLIGVLWPLGRGNVGYGANVGSNHTGRIPDQEACAGEGLFWGLSCVIKFPVDMTFSPYSLVAAGTSLPPQRICMPFSLIVSTTDNEIIPGWVLQSSPYTLARNAKKFANRRKAKRHDFYTGWSIFRPETMEMCRWALNALETTDDLAKVPGLGANKLSQRARDVGIKAYRDALRRYSLHGLLDWVTKMLSKESTENLNEAIMQLEFLTRVSDPQPPVDLAQGVDWPTWPWEAANDREWDYQKRVLLEEFPLQSNEVEVWVGKLLNELVVLEQDYVIRIHKCKSRDDSRGSTTIPGYSQAHVAAEKDTVIVQARRELASMEKVVADVLAQLSTSANRSRL